MGPPGLRLSHFMCALLPTPNPSPPNSCLGSNVTSSEKPSLTLLTPHVPHAVRPFLPSAGLCKCHSVPLSSLPSRCRRRALTTQPPAPGCDLWEGRGCILPIPVSLRLSPWLLGQWLLNECTASMLTRK